MEATMRVAMAAAFKQPQPLVNFQGGLNKETVIRRKDKVVFVSGAIGFGKSRLAIDLATRHPAEVLSREPVAKCKYPKDFIWSATGSLEECQGIPQHLIGILDRNTDLTSEDSSHLASVTVKSIAPNSYIEALLNDDDDCDFRLRSELSLVNRIIDKVLGVGVRNIFDRNQTEYSRGIRRATGVPELYHFLRCELGNYRGTRIIANLLDIAISKIKEFTCRQLQNIRRLQNEWKWHMHRSDPLMRELIITLAFLMI